MRLYQPDFAESFVCLADRCDDCCCRQGWQIPVDDRHLGFYRELPGELGEKVRSALTDDGLRMENGVCSLLRPDGLCPIVAELGQDALCDLCRTHPRFIEQYGGTREIHFSLSCPEVSRLAILRDKPIAFTETTTDEPVTEWNDIDPQEYLTLLRIRDFAVRLVQQRKIPILDRLALLLNLSGSVQRILREKRYEVWRSVERRYRDGQSRKRILARLRRLRLRGSSILPDLFLLHEAEHLTEEISVALKAAAFTAGSSRPFDGENAVVLENMTVLWLSHYIPKAINDGRADTKILLSVFLALTVRRFCVCSGRATAADAARYAGLLAKELEHSEENLAMLEDAFRSSDYWRRHLIGHLDLEGGSHAI